LRDIIENNRGSVVLRDSIENNRDSVVLRYSIENDNMGSMVLLCVVKVMTCSIDTDKQVALELRGSSFSSLSH
jgi:hypothetical protein